MSQTPMDPRFLSNPGTCNPAELRIRDEVLCLGNAMGVRLHGKSSIKVYRSFIIYNVPCHWRNPRQIGGYPPNIDWTGIN
jgi:hypothetical protein